MIDASDFRLIRSGRHSLALEIQPNGELWVRAPRSCPEREINAFLQSHEGWIREKRAKVLSGHEKRMGLLAEGSELPYLGGRVTVRYYQGSLPARWGEELILPEEAAEEAFLSWRKSEAELILRPRVEYWSRLCNLTPSKLSFGNARHRWGSMGSNGHMNLNTALIHLPLSQIDYIIVHELCHMLHPDHSPAFHESVRSFLPRADQLREAIRAQGAPLYPVRELEE